MALTSFAKFLIKVFNCKICSSDTENSSVFEIEMLNPMHFETMTNTTAHDVIFLTEIRIKLTYGIFTEQLKSILDNLVNLIFLLIEFNC